MADPGFDLSKTFVHLGDGASAAAVADFAWTEEFLTHYEHTFDTGAEAGRLVCISPQAATWTSWECHPEGEELVVCLSGRLDLIQEIKGRKRKVPLLPGRAVINPRGVWHYSVVEEPGLCLFITPGRHTEHRPV